MALAVFLLGTQLVAQPTYPGSAIDAYRWIGGTSSNWTVASNWEKGTFDYSTMNWSGTTNEAPPTNANLVFMNASPAFNLTIPSGGVTPTWVFVLVDQQINLDGNLSPTNLVVEGSGFNTMCSLNLVRNATEQLNISGQLILGKSTTHGAEIVTSATSLTITMQSTANLYMYSVAGVGSNIGENTTVSLANANFLKTDACFYGVVQLNGLDVPLGTNDIFMGYNAKFDGYETDVTKSNGAGSIVTQGGISNSSDGHVYKEFARENETFEADLFVFPFKTATPALDRVTHLAMTVDFSCMTKSLIDWNKKPFPAISARLVYNPSGGNGGHPCAESTAPTVLFHWPILNYGYPEETWVQDQNTGEWSIDPNTSPTAIKGYMAFHNNYRNGSTNLFPAVYVGPVEEESPVGCGGVYDIRGSEYTPVTTGNLRTIPFGKYYGSLPGYTGTYDWSAFTNAGCMYAFGDLTCGTGANFFVPVELVSFSARYYSDSKTVNLKWMTATELNNLGFWVERSVDGDRWETLDEFVPGSGTSNVPLSYTFTDRLDERMTQHPKIAYRLRQVDRDGTIDYSSIVYVHTGTQPETVELYKAYPNPFNPSTTLSFSLQEPTNVTLRVYNTLGMEVATLLVGRSMDAGFHNIEFQGTDLTSGVYIAVLEAAGTLQQQKLVLSK